MLQNALASACDCTEVVGFVGSKWNAVVFYCDHVEHQQSVIAQQSAAINWMRICIQSRSFTWSDYTTIYSWKQEVLVLLHHELLKKCKGMHDKTLCGIAGSS